MISNTKFGVTRNFNLLLQGLLLSTFLLFSDAILAFSSENDLFIDVNSSQTVLGAVDPSIVIRQKAVAINIEDFSEADTELQLNLFDDVQLTAILDHIEVDALGNQAWVGTIQDAPNSSVSLVMSNGKLSGSVNLPDVCYHIRHVQNQLHVIREIDVVALQEVVNGSNQEILSEYPGLQWYQQFQEQEFVEALPLVSSFLGPEEQQVLDLVNQERAVRGLNLLAADELLSNAARAHSQDMSQKNYFSHTSLDGRSAGQRIAESGYSFNTWGENIAAGYTTAASVMNGWMNSAGHKANILNTSFCDIGVGYAAAGRLWTQDFGRKQGILNCPPVDDSGNPGEPNPPTSTPTPTPTPPATGSTLSNGSAKNFSLARNEVAEFIVELPANVTNFKVSINGGGDADLYVKKDEFNWPYDGGPHNSPAFKSLWISGSNETVSFNSPTKGTWHILIHGYTNSSGSVTATWQVGDTSGNSGGTNENSNVLSNGSEKSFSLARNQIIEYGINVPSSARNLQVSIMGNGDADLYVKKLPIHWPQDNGYKNQPEFKAPWRSGSNETVLFSRPTQGSWHVLIHGYQQAQGKIKITWQ